MKITVRRIIAIHLVILLLAIWGGNAQAKVRILRNYRLGEVDTPLPVAGMPTHDQTVDGVNGINATKVGISEYGVSTCSSLAVRFKNVDSRFEAPAELISVTDNFGIEACITPNQFGPVLDGRPFYNGDHAFPLDIHSRGYGLIIADGRYQGLFGIGAQGGAELGRIDTGVMAAAGVSVWMALVRNGGITRVYINGDPVSSFLVTSAPNAPQLSDKLSIGNFFHSGPDIPFAGVVDEARIFDFAPGEFDPSDLTRAMFIRSDSNSDGEIDLSDANTVLSFLFTGGKSPSCLDAADTNDDGTVDVSDAIFTLGFLFLGSAAPPAPGPSACGADPTPDDLALCAQSEKCQ